MDGPLYKTVVRTYEARERDALEKDVNAFLESHPSATPNIFKDACGLWCASITYKEPINSKQSGNGFVDIKF